MSTEPHPQSYNAGLNQALLRAVPADAVRILDVGCAEGHLGAALKQLVPERRIFGTERRPEIAAQAARKLDQVLAIDVATDALPLEANSFDCIVLGELIAQLVDPEAVLRRLRRLLAPGGQILCSIPNGQHFSMIAALLTGDLRSPAAGVGDTTRPRLFTASAIQKLFLDAGYEPSFVQAVRIPCPANLLTAAHPLLDHFGLHHGRMAHYLSAHEYIVRGQPLAIADSVVGDSSNAEATPPESIPLSIVLCVSDESILQANLLASPCLREGALHEVIAVRGCSNAAAGLNSGIERARHELVVLTHQDVYLPRGWAARLIREYREAERRFGPLGVAGVYGVAMTDTGPRRIGHVVDRDALRTEETPLPALVDTLDELLMVVPRGTPLRFDPSLGFHFYGADICLTARERGLAAVVIDALCLHNSRTIEVPETFLSSGTRFARKWAARLPIATPCALIDREGTIRGF